MLVMYRRGSVGAVVRVVVESQDGVFGHGQAGMEESVWGMGKCMCGLAAEMGCV